MVSTSPEFERLNQARMQELVQNIRELAHANNRQQLQQEALVRLATTGTRP